MVAGAPAQRARAEERAPIAVVVHPSFDAASALTLAILRQLYLGERTRIGDTPVRCYDLAPGNPVRDVFGRRVLPAHGKALLDYWLEQALTGGRLPPREVQGEAELLARVSRDPGALGYARLAALRAAPDSPVKLMPLLVDGRVLVPGDEGYPLAMP